MTMSTKPGVVYKFSAACICAAGTGFAGENSRPWWMPDEGITTFSDKVDTLFYALVITTLVPFGIVVAALLYFCVRYRHTKGAKAHYTHGNSLKATILTGTLATCVFLGID